jgi:raffinose/stachyose/melibiose transport system permease protein
MEALRELTISRRFRLANGSVAVVAKRIWRARYLYMLILPTFVLLVVFSYLPILQGLRYSFYRWDGYRAHYIGLENYRNLLRDPALIVSWKNVSFILLFQLATQLTMPLLVAWLIYRLPHDRPRYWFRVLFTMPMVVPNVVVWLIWIFMYAEYGGINSLLSDIGLRKLVLGATGTPRAWLGDPDTALLAVLFVGFPWVLSVNMLLYLAGLEAISTEILDASVVDGASAWSRFWYIELPMIMGQVRLITVLTTIRVLQGFQDILVLTAGGPGYSTMVPGLRMAYAAFHFQQASRIPRMGYGCAVAVVIFMAIVVVTIANMKLFRSPEQ